MKDRLLQLGINTYKKIARHYTLMPRFVNVESTKMCNLKCPNCRRNYPAGSISTEPGPKHLTVGALWRIVATTPMEVVRFEGDGEPTINPNFKDLLRFCKQMGIRSAMTTNATLLDKDLVEFMEKHGMARIHVSFDGAEKDTFEKVRLGADYDKVLYNCKLLGKSGIQLFMSVVLSSDRIIEELPMYLELAQSVGTTGIHLMKFQQESLEFGNPPNLAKYKDVLRKFGEDVRSKDLVYAGTVTDNPTFMECHDTYVCPYVLLNDDVYPCTYIANLRRSEVYFGKEFSIPYSNYKMGNLKDNWMKDIWKNEAYKELKYTLKATRHSNGTLMTPEDLLEMKKLVVDISRFSYCVGCLGRWGESGL